MRNHIFINLRLEAMGVLDPLTKLELMSKASAVDDRYLLDNNIYIYT